MTAPFGPEVERELFSPRNGLLLHGLIENSLDAGLFVIVPHIDDIRDAGEALQLGRGHSESLENKDLGLEMAEVRR